MPLGEACSRSGASTCPFRARSDDGVALLADFRVQAQYALGAPGDSS
jgi:hypothetical protein